MAEEKSLREELIAARDEYVESTEDETTETSAADATSEASAETPAEGEVRAQEQTPESAGSPTRDANGRFVSTKQTEDAGQLRDNSGSAAATPPQGGVEPPQSWTAAEKAFWAKLPIEAQRTIARREGDYHKAITKHDEERAMARDFQKATAPYEATLKAINTTPLQAYQTLLNATYVLRTGSPQQKFELLVNAARDAGIDLRHLAQAQSQQPQQPNYAQLPPQVLQELQAARTFREQMETEKQAAETAAYNTIVSDIDTFRADPANPHFDAVRETMVSLIQSGAAPDLKSAYDQATWATPSIRAELIKSQSQGQVRRDKVQQAKQKGGSVRGGPGASPDAAPTNRTVREELEAAFSQSAGRV